MMSEEGSEIFTVDKIVTIARALFNHCDSIYPFIDFISVKTHNHNEYRLLSKEAELLTVSFRQIFRVLEV